MELTAEEVRRRLAAAGAPVSPERAEALRAWSSTLNGLMQALRQAPVHEPLVEPATIFPARWEDAARGR